MRVLDRAPVFTSSSFLGSLGRRCLSIFYRALGEPVCVLLSATNFFPATSARILGTGHYTNSNLEPLCGAVLTFGGGVELTSARPILGTRAYTVRPVVRKCCVQRV